MTDHGSFTGKMGKALSEYYAGKVHRVFYDHGRDLKTEPYYCKPTPFSGEKCTSASSLSYVDIAVVNRETNSVELIAEVEESGHEPKKIIGDVVNLFLADGIRVKRKDYALGDLVLVLGLQAKVRGKARAKANEICEKLQAGNLQHGKRKITIYPLFDQDLDKLVSNVRCVIENELTRLGEAPPKRCAKF